MSLAKKIVIVGLIVFVLIQFIRPDRNVSDQLITKDDISNTYNIPDNAHQILIKKCYDCHSNTTEYPWYANIQPAGWWMASHVTEGKEDLNFSIFKTYAERKANHKIEEISEAVNEGWMPLDSYLWIHHKASITEADRVILNAWIKTLPIKFEDHHQ